MPGESPQIVQTHKFGVIVGEHHVDPAGKQLASLIRHGFRRTGGGTIAVPVDQTLADGMLAAASIAVVAVVKVCRIQGEIGLQRKHVVPD